MNTATSTVTKQRAQQILTTAGDLAEARFGIRAAWDAYLGQAMTEDERSAVVRVWKTLPGH